ncbi:MFS transporter [Comamonadaceae bacterium OH2310_COT-174]|nr:MFS transporter [Comamonadaceae bacterium OH2310_COT-174]
MARSPAGLARPAGASAGADGSSASRSSSPCAQPRFAMADPFPVVPPPLSPMGTSPSLHCIPPGWPHVLAAIGGVYVTQTIVTGLVTQALPTLLRDAGASLTVAGLTALLWAPWGLRFFWAPHIERWRLPAGQTQRRSRALVLTGQWLMAAVLAALGLAGLLLPLTLSAHAPWMLAALLLAALVAATADVACDGFAVEQLSARWRGWGNAVQVGGSYVGAMLGAGGFLLLAGRLGWPMALCLTAALMALLGLPMLTLREPARPACQALAHRPGIAHALRRPELRTGLALLLLCSAGVRLSLGMFGPLLLDRGMDLQQVGWVFGTLHLAAGLGGAIVGGLLVRRCPGWRAVAVAMCCKAIVLAALALAARPDEASSTAFLVALIGLMFTVMACLWVALYAALMGLASPLQPGVDFTLCQSADALLALAGGVLGGWLSQRLGYAACFALAALLAALAMVRVSHQVKQQARQFQDSAANAGAAP